MENYALVQRPAAYTWEAQAILAGNVQAAPPVKITFPRPVIILSAYPSIAYQGGNNALQFPVLDDILVEISTESGLERRLTSRFDQTTPNGISALPQVTLGSYRDTVGGARTMHYELGDPGGSRPEVDVTFSWKYQIGGGTIFQDIFVSLAFHCNFLDGKQ